MTFKELTVAKNCHRPESVSLKERITVWSLEFAISSL